MRNLKNNPAGVRRISVLGSTGSIGTQTLDIVRLYPDRFRVVALTACRNWELLARQAFEFKPEVVSIADEAYYAPLAEALHGSGVRVLAGTLGVEEAAASPGADFVVGALVGYSGLRPTLAALHAGKTVALANKETLVAGGQLVEPLMMRDGRRMILPIDSEHSAIFQCLLGEEKSSVAKIILTASGGPFRTFSKEQLQKVTVAQALAHPNWKMGPKVTVDSATMMNKGFEMIEARWLFGINPSDIEVVVHPESIVHSMVRFTDGSVKAQLGLPDMHIPISVALGFPHRIHLDNPTLDLTQTSRLTFEKPNLLNFPLLGLAYAASEAGGLVPTVMNAANELAVKAFLDRKIGFADISSVVVATVNASKSEFKDAEVTLDNIQCAHSQGTEIARGFIMKKYKD